MILGIVRFCINQYLKINSFIMFFITFYKWSHLNALYYIQKSDFNENMFCFQIQFDSLILSFQLIDCQRQRAEVDAFYIILYFYASKDVELTSHQSCCQYHTKWKIMREGEYSSARVI